MTMETWNFGTAFQEYLVWLRGQWNIPLLGQFLPPKFTPALKRYFWRYCSICGLQQVTHKAGRKNVHDPGTVEWTNAIRQMVIFPLNWLFQFTERQKESTDPNGCIMQKWFQSQKKINLKGGRSHSQSWKLPENQPRSVQLAHLHTAPGKLAYSLTCTCSTNLSNELSLPHASPPKATLH